jgi:DegV family protein with EDD domain
MIHIITDSTCDLTQMELDKLQVATAPLTVHFADESFRDGLDITPSAFYQKLEKSKNLPTTSQATPASFEQLLKPIVEKGDEAVILTISSTLSATWQSACMAAMNTNPEKVHVVDSRTASGGLAMLVRKAAAMRDAGTHTAQQIAETIRQLGPRIVILASIDTLKYLQMGGRVSRTTAVVGGLLNVSPLLRVQDGEIITAGKARSEKSAIKFLLDLYKELEPDRDSGIVFFNGDAAPRMERFIEAFHQDISGMSLYRSRMGSVIGTHTGPGVVAIAFLSNKE